MPSVWAASFVSPIPVNQLDALPLLTLQEFIDGHGADTAIYADHVLKYWSPTVLGITAGTPTLDPDAGVKYELHTPWLDVTPCMFFCFVILRNIPGGDNVQAQPLKLCLQYKQTATETPPLSRNPIDDPYTGIWDLVSQATAIIFPALAGPAVQRFNVTISPNSAAQSTIQNVALAFGPFVRFQLNWMAVAPAGTDHSTYSMSMWGSS
jgi:hypothetical protein